jgi:hypothetical protein
MENPVTEVPLRKRSTPYDFTVTVSRGSERRRLYKGTSANYAKASYWQAIQMATFLGLHGSIHMSVFRDKQSYGVFTTEHEGGKVKLLHVPSGKCIEWTTGSWSGDHLAEKLLATIPGVPGPLPFAE